MQSIRPCEDARTSIRQISTTLVFNCGDELDLELLVAAYSEFEFMLKPANT